MRPKGQRSFHPMHGSDSLEERLEKAQQAEAAKTRKQAAGSDARRISQAAVRVT